MCCLCKIVVTAILAQMAWRKQEQNYESPLDLIWWDKIKRQFKQTAIEHSVKRKRQERRERSELEEKLIKLQQQANTTGNDHV